jgi:hypothetical protein
MQPRRIAGGSVPFDELTRNDDRGPAISGIRVVASAHPKRLMHFRCTYSRHLTVHVHSDGLISRLGSRTYQWKSTP